MTPRASLLSVPTALAYQDGALYYPSSATVTPAIQTMSVGDASVQPLTMTWPGAPVSIDTLWAEGDHLLLTAFEQFYSLPLAGGAVQPIYDGAETTDADSNLQAFSETDFFWTDLAYNSQDVFSTTVRRGARGGGPPIDLGTLPNIFQGMALGADALILGGPGTAVAVPLDGGPARPLADVRTFFAGVDASGVYWSVVSASNPDDAQILRSPADGSPGQVFWPSIPPWTAPLGVWPDGQGGWVVTASQVLDDRLFHLTVWSIDAGGNGQLLACDPDVAGHAFPATFGPAIAPDAVYLVTGYLGDGGLWEIDRVAR